MFKSGFSPDMFSRLVKTKILLSRKRQDIQNPIKVAVRIRPISEPELSLGCTEIIKAVEENMVCLLDPSENELDILRANRSREKTYVFDNVFGPDSSQADVYEQSTKALVESVLEGYNATIFAYGPTGAGKTHTMLGTDYEPGIMVLTLNDLYKQMDRTSNDQKYTVKMSYIEIYNEMIRDLLNPTADFLDLREDHKGVQVSGLSEYEALTTSEVMEMLSRGNLERMCEPTVVNKTSSRSHAILQVTVEQQSRLRNFSDEVKVAKLFMVDLAGSERAAQTQNTGKRFIEGAHINRSLLALGNCINALTEKGTKTSTYVNYRDSKLTRLLKDSLGGNCKTVMITHVSPANMSFEESRNTLTYADRAKSIKLKPKQNQFNVNYHVAQYQTIISDLRQEIIRLKTQLIDVDSIQRGSASTYSRIQSASFMEKLKDELKSSFQEQLELRKEIIELEDSALQYSVEYQRHLLVIDEWEQEQAKQRAREGKDETSRRAIKGKFLHKKHMAYDPFDIERKDMHTEKAVTKMREPADVTIAREELQNITQRHEEITERKKELLDRLEQHKKEKEYLEEAFPKKVSNEQQGEIFKTLCKMHEFQIRNIELEAISMMREYLIQEKDLAIQRTNMRHNLVEEIVHLQQRLIAETNIKYPVDLEALFQMYKEQISRDVSVMSTLTIDANGLGSRVPSLPSLVEDSKSNDEHVTNTHLNERLQVKKKWLDSNMSDQESIVSSKFNLTRNPFPRIINDSDTLSDATISQTNNRVKKNTKKQSKEISRMNRRSTFVYKEDGSVIPDVPSMPSISKPTRQNFTLHNSKTYRKIDIADHIRHTSRENDTQSVSPMQTVGIKLNKQEEDFTERKRSASAGLIREKHKLLHNRSLEENQNKKKTDKQYKNNKPGWNSNFAHKVNQDTQASYLGTNYLPKYTKPRNTTVDRLQQTIIRNNNTIDGAIPTITVNNSNISHQLKKSKFSQRTNLNNTYMVRHGPSNENLVISGTSFVPKASQPGFGRI